MLRGVLAPFSSRSCSTLHAALYKALRPRGVVSFVSNGSRLFVDARDMSSGYPLLSRGHYRDDPYGAAALGALLRDSMVFIDVGANVGYYTLLAAQLVGTRGRIYAFEPAPDNSRLLATSIHANCYENVVLFQEAVGDSRDPRVLYVSQSNHGRHSFAAANVNRCAGCINVKVRPLDELLGTAVDRQENVVVKIDVEGAEGLVWAGGRALWRRTNCTIIMEYWPAGLRRLGTDPLFLLHEIVSYGFRLHVIDPLAMQFAEIPVPVLRKLKHSELLNLYLHKGCLHGHPIRTWATSAGPQTVLASYSSDGPT